MEGPKLAREAVTLAGVDGECFVTELTAGAALTIIMAPQGERPMALGLLQKCLVRADGTPVYATPDELAASLPFTQYLALHPIARRLNGLDEDALGKA